VANSRTLCKASRPSELSFTTCSPEALLEWEILACILVSYHLQLWGGHNEESAFLDNTKPHSYFSVFGRPVLVVLDQLNLCLHSRSYWTSAAVAGEMGTRPAPYGDLATVVPACQNKNSSHWSPGTVCIQKIPKMGKWAWRCHQKISPCFGAV